MDKTFLAGNQNAKLATERMINSDTSPLSWSVELTLLFWPSFRATNICRLLGETKYVVVGLQASAGVQG